MRPKEELKMSLEHEKYFHENMAFQHEFELIFQSENVALYFPGSSDAKSAE